MATSSDVVTARLAEPGFTPSIRSLDQLLALFDDPDEERTKLAERAILKIEARYAARVASGTVARASEAVRPGRGRLTRLAGRLASEARDPEGSARAWLLEAVADADPKTRRAAARALGKLDPAPDIERALVAAFDRAANDPEGEHDRRALAMALGKAGPEAAKSRLEGTAHGRARVIVDREIARKAPGRIDPARAPARQVRLWVHTRAGLEAIAIDELGGAFGHPRRCAPAVVEARLHGPLEAALRIRTATHVGFPLPPVRATGDLARDIVTALGGAEARAIFDAFTDVPPGEGRVRFRLAFARGGHRRAVAWRCAELVRAEHPALVNDPKESTWEVVVDDAREDLALELVPRGFVDERFGYRRDVVAASSHPTVAAALARVAPRNAGDVVWDPFAGAGAELVERGLAGPYARLIGTDLDPHAVAAARANVARAGLANVELGEADASTHAPTGVTCIITNPPMGRRVERGGHAQLLDRFIAHAARVLVPGGVLVWLVPEPARRQPHAEAAGFVALREPVLVDMGGFSAELSIWQTKRDR